MHKKLTRLIAGFLFLLSLSGCFWYVDGGGHHHGRGHWGHYRR